MLMQSVCWKLNRYSISLLLKSGPQSEDYFAMEATSISFSVDFCTDIKIILSLIFFFFGTAFLFS